MPMPLMGAPAPASMISTIVQCAYEGAAMSLPTTLSWPDVIVGPGILDGSMVSSLEQLLIDIVYIDIINSRVIINV